VTLHSDISTTNTDDGMVLLAGPGGVAAIPGSPQPYGQQVAQRRSVSSLMA